MVTHIDNAPESFPQGDNTFLVQGPAGALEVVSQSPKQDLGQFIAIVCHPHPQQEGTMNNKVVTTLVRTYNQLGIPAVRFNFRGVGKSEGEYDNAKGECDDLLAVINWVKKVKPDTPICLAGFSFGSYIAYKVASEGNYAHLVSVAPPLKYVDFKKLERPSCPWVVIQGDEDDVVDPNDLFAWLEEMSNPPELIKMLGVGHFFHGRLIELRDKLAIILQEQLDIQQ